MADLVRRPMRARPARHMPWVGGQPERSRCGGLAADPTSPRSDSPCLPRTWLGPPARTTGPDHRTGRPVRRLRAGGHRRREHHRLSCVAADAVGAGHSLSPSGPSATDVPATSRGWRSADDVRGGQTRALTPTVGPGPSQSRCAGTPVHRLWLPSERSRRAGRDARLTSSPPPTVRQNRADGLPG
jgi:hypothetical protein